MNPKIKAELSNCNTFREMLHCIDKNYETESIKLSPTIKIAIITYIPKLINLVNAKER